MKIINIRKTQSGWVADAYINAKAILPVSIPVLECSADDLMEFAASDPEHDTINEQAQQAAEAQEIEFQRLLGYAEQALAGVNINKREVLAFAGLWKV